MDTSLDWNCASAIEAEGGPQAAASRKARAVYSCKEPNPANNHKHGHMSPPSEALR